MIRVLALVGFTNVGKSTMMESSLQERRSLRKNKLFATLDTTVRKVIIENLPFLLSDTVGLSVSCLTDWLIPSNLLG